MLLFMPSDCLIVSSHFDKVISFAAAASHPGISNLSCLGGRAYSKILPLSIHPDLEGAPKVVQRGKKFWKRCVGRDFKSAGKILKIYWPSTKGTRKSNLDY